MILNLTQHNATPAQIEAGVVEPRNKGAVQQLLTFDAPPGASEIQKRAAKLADLARKEGVKAAMIGGAPFFMSALESALMDVGVRPLYAFSQRQTVETQADDGSVMKKSIFVHVGFVDPYDD